MFSIFPLKIVNYLIPAVMLKGKVYFKRICKHGFLPRTVVLSP